MPSVYVFDTNTVSGPLKKGTGPLRPLKIPLKIEGPERSSPLFQRAVRAQQPGLVVSCAIVRGEVRYGLERLPAGKRRANLETKANAVFATLPIESVTAAAADIYGTTRRILELQGYNLSDNDLWIAATTLSLGAVLVSNDQGFTHVPGLVVEDWTL
jgi:predicted nucleic acid-binding protein